MKLFRRIDEGMTSFHDVKLILALIALASLGALVVGIAVAWLFLTT